MGVGPNQFGTAIRPEQIDLGLAVTEDVHVGWLVVAGENHHPQAMGAQRGNLIDISPIVLGYSAPVAARPLPIAQSRGEVR